MYKNKKLLLVLLVSIGLILIGCKSEQVNDDIPLVSSQTESTDIAAESSKSTEENLSEKEEETTLVVGTFNIDTKAPEHDVNDQRKLLSDQGVEVFGIQEVTINTKRHNIDQYDPFTDFQKEEYVDSYFGQSIKKGSGGYGNGIVSAFPILESSVTQLYGVEQAPKELMDELIDIYENLDDDDEKTMEKMMRVWGEDGLVTKGALEPRSYSRAIIEKDGKQIAFYSTHLSVESSDVRKEQLKELSITLQKDPIEYKIIVGDFNTDQGKEEYDVFLENGFVLANGYNDVWIETMEQKDSAREASDIEMNIKYLDNIIVSSNIDIISVKAIETDLSDHYPLIAELILK